MVLSGNSTQANCSRTSSVVALSGKEQISPVLLLSDNAPDNHSEMEQSCMLRTSLRNRKKPSLGVEKPRDKPSNGFVSEKTFADVKNFVTAKQLSSPMANDNSTFRSLVDFLSKTPPDALPLGKNGIASLWTCGQCCQTFLSSAELQVHLASHNALPPALDNAVKSVIATNKKRQSPLEITVSKRVKRSSSPEASFEFEAAGMQHTASNGETYYKCDICETLFAISDLTGFKIHYLRSHINYQFISSSDRALCSIVDDGLKSKVTDHLYRCYFCNVSCSEKKILIEHNAEHKSNVFRCQYCHAVFYQNKAFTNHVKNCTKSPRAHIQKQQHSPNAKSLINCTKLSLNCTKSPLNCTKSPPACSKSPLALAKPPRIPSSMTLCLYCKDPTYFTDRDVHTKEYHTYSNGQLRIECFFGCGTKIKKLPDLYRHYVSVHRDVYFGCVPCKVRFLSVELLRNHHKTKHNVDMSLGDKKQVLALTNKADKKPGVQSAVKPNGQLMVKTNSPSIVKTNGQTSVKQNGQAGVKATSRSVSPSLTLQQRHMQDILFKSILKVDLVEQVNILKQHAAQYPGLVQLPPHPVFSSNVQDSSCPHCPAPGEEEFLRPVFSSSQENNVYICKACGLQTEVREELTFHMGQAHPHIHNDYFVFSREDLPQDLWSLCQPSEVKGKAASAARNRTLHTCTGCSFECRESAEFHKHLLLCAKKNKLKAELCKAKAGGVKKEDLPNDPSRRRMVITGVLRQVPDDPLFSYKKELEKTIRKPGDSETVFNMLNKLPSKRLVKTTERYDSLYYKNNKAMKPKRTSLERLTLGFHEKDFCYTLSDYLKYFMNHESREEKPVVPYGGASPALPSDPATGEMSKVALEKKIKVARSSSSSEELTKVPGDKKVKAKACPGQTKDRVGEKRVKSPKLGGGEENRQSGDGKKCKVPKSNAMEEKKAKVVKSHSVGDPVKKMNGISSQGQKIVEVGEKKRKLSETERIMEDMKPSLEDMGCKALQNVKVVQLHYPTMNMKGGNKARKNILVEKKGKNQNSTVKKKGKHHLDTKKKVLVKMNSKSKNRNHLMKGEGKKPNCDRSNGPSTVALREVSPRKKKTTRIVVVSDEPLLPLLTMKKDKKK